MPIDCVAIMISTLPLRDAVEAFISTTGVSPTAFGRLALNDPGFVFEIRRGRRVWPETEARVRAYIAANPPAKPRRRPSSAEAA